MNTMASWDNVRSTLIGLAVNARQRAYAPYSRFQVGCAVLAENPESTWLRYFTGVNIENASYGLTICAERVAIFNAIEAGHTKIHSLACCAPSMPGVVGTSCGACRQVMHEFNSKMDVVYVDDAGQVYMETIANALLPKAFALGVSHG